MTSEPTRQTIPEYEVQAFFDALYPEGWTRKGLGVILGVDRITVARWIAGGMPVPKARELIAHKIMETIRANAEIARIMDEYKI